MKIKKVSNFDGTSAPLIHVSRNNRSIDIIIIIIINILRNLKTESMKSKNIFLRQLPELVLNIYELTYREIYGLLIDIKCKHVFYWKTKYLVFFYPSMFKIPMSLTYFKPVFPFYLSDFLMFRSIQSLRNPTMVGGEC